MKYLYKYYLKSNESETHEEPYDSREEAIEAAVKDYNANADRQPLGILMRMDDASIHLFMALDSIMEEARSPKQGKILYFPD